MAFTPTIKELVSSDGATIHAEATGNPSKPSLVFVHGSTLSSIVFDDLFADDRLLNEFYLVRYDMRGHGRSEKPETMDGHASSLYAADFAALVTAFKLSKPIIIGWSLGATVVADICTHLSPLPISGAVYIAGVPYIGEIMHSLARPFALGAISTLTNVSSSVASNKTATLAFVDSLFYDPASVPFIVKSSWIGQSVLQSPTVTGLIFSRPQDPKRLREQAKEGLPLLCIDGQEDKQIDGDFVCREMRSLFVDFEEVVVEGGGHAVFYDKPKEVVDAIVRFARRVLKYNNYR